MWRFNVDSHTWTHLSGNRTRNTYANYDVAYIGGLHDHTMQSYGDLIYVFGGRGYTGTNYGIF